MTPQIATDSAVTGEERSYDSLHGDPALQGHWIIYDPISYEKGSCTPGRVIVRAVTEQNLHTMRSAFKNVRSTTPHGSVIGVEFIKHPQRNLSELPSLHIV